MTMVKRRFQEASTLSAFEELRRLYQTGTVKEYMQKFERVKSRLQIESPHWPESEFLNAL